jgi:hypothetical protein
MHAFDLGVVFDLGVRCEGRTRLDVTKTTVKAKRPSRIRARGAASRQ